MSLGRSGYRAYLKVCVYMGLHLYVYMVRVCLCVCMRLEVNASNEQLFHEQHGEIRRDCFSSSSSVFIVFSSMNMYYFGNLK